MTLTASSSTGVDRFAEPTRRRTVAQAVIEYLQVQFTEFDGERARLIPAVYGIFGHGNHPARRHGFAAVGAIGGNPVVDLRDQ